MSTAVLDRPDTTVADLEAMLEDGAICMYKQGNFSMNTISFECDQPATWAGICRHCGTVSLLCEKHYAHLNSNNTTKMRCSRCKRESNRFVALYFCIHKI